MNTTARAQRLTSPVRRAAFGAAAVLVAAGTALTVAGPASAATTSSAAEQTVPYVEGMDLTISFAFENGTDRPFGSPIDDGRALVTDTQGHPVEGAPVLFHATSEYCSTFAPYDEPTSPETTGADGTAYAHGLTTFERCTVSTITPGAHKTARVPVNAYVWSGPDLDRLDADDVLYLG